LTQNAEACLIYAVHSAREALNAVYNLPPILWAASYAFQSQLIYCYTQSRCHLGQTYLVQRNHVLDGGAVRILVPLGKCDCTISVKQQYGLISNY